MLWPWWMNKGFRCEHEKLLFHLERTYSLPGACCDVLKWAAGMAIFHTTVKGPSVNEPLVGDICLLNHDLYKWALSPVISKVRTLLTSRGEITPHQLPIYRVPGASIVTWKCATGKFRYNWCKKSTTLQKVLAPQKSARAWYVNMIYD